MDPESSEQPAKSKQKGQPKTKRRHCMIDSCQCKGCESCAGHKFPPKAEIKKQWIAAVKLERPDYCQTTWSVDHKICSHHFTDDCFTVPPAVVKSLASTYKVNIRLKAGSVPTLNLKTTTQEKPKPERRSLAVVKRINLETIASYEAAKAKELQLQKEKAARVALAKARRGETETVSVPVFNPLETPRVILLPHEDRPTHDQPGSYLYPADGTKQEPGSVKLETTPTQPVLSAVDRAKFIEKVLTGTIEPIWNAPGSSLKPPFKKPAIIKTYVQRKRFVTPKRNILSISNKCVICNIPSDSGDTDIADIRSFHTCPSNNKEQKAKWIFALPKEVRDLHGVEYLLNNQWKLCSKHFCNDDYHFTSNAMAEKTGMRPGHNRLKSGTVPTQNLLHIVANSAEMLLPSSVTARTNLLNTAPIVVKPDSSIDYESSDQTWKISDGLPNSPTDDLLPVSIQCKTEDEDCLPYAEPITIAPIHSGQPTDKTDACLPSDKHPVSLQYNPVLSNPMKANLKRTSQPSKPVVPVALVTKCIVSSKNVKGAPLLVRPVKNRYLTLNNSTDLSKVPSSSSAEDCETKHGSAIIEGTVKSGGPAALTNETSALDQGNTQPTSDEADGPATISQNSASQKTVRSNEDAQEKEIKSEGQSRSNPSSVVIDCSELFPAESIYTKAAEGSLKVVKDHGSCSNSGQTSKAVATTSSVAAAGTNDLPNMAAIRPAGISYDESSAVLAMDVEDEEPQFTGTANTQVYLSDITSNIHKQKKGKKGLLVELDDIEHALFPADLKQESSGKKKKNSKKQSKKAVKPKQDTIDECKADLRPDADSVASSGPPNESAEKHKSVPMDEEFDYETFFDTSSEDEEVEEVDANDPDWDLDLVDLIGENGKIKNIDQDNYDESDDEDSDSEGEEDPEEETLKEQFDCDKCDVQYDDFWQHLVAHKLNEHPEDLPLCHICNVSCCETSLSSHMEEVHKMKRFPDRKLDHLFCPSCKDIHSSTLSYIFHWEEVHEQCLLVCELCDFEAGHRFQMKTHMQNSHSLTDFQEYLKYITLTKKEVNMKKKHKVPYTYCFMCSRKCSSGRKLKEHQEEMHAEAFEQKVFQCCECKKVSCRLLELAKHYHSVHVDTGIKCKFCPRKSIPKMYNYRDHIERIHCKIKKHFCEECNLIISTGGPGLRVHVDKVHNNVRNNLCDTCGRGFKSADALIIHNLIHTGEKPVACSHCDYRCRQRTSLNWHMKTTHPDEMPVKCAVKLPGRPRGKALTKKNSNIKQSPVKRKLNAKVENPTKKQKRSRRKKTDTGY